MCIPTLISPSPTPQSPHSHVGWDVTADFIGGPEFTGERFDDCHYTVAMKWKAREEAMKNNIRIAR